ncbi:MAG: rod shape-determining protein MreC, partial [Clostridium sp.]|nr:rod shape-determining protein MreC [Clostridium sp.]
MKRSRIIVTVLSVFCILLIGLTSFNSSFLAPLRNGAGLFLVPMERGVNALGGGIYNRAKNLA